MAGKTPQVWLNELAQDSGQSAVEPVEPTPTENAVPAPQVADGDKLTFEKRQWAGAKDVYHCNFCGEDRDKKDEIILHILDHAPEKDRSALLDKLTKEK